MFLLDCANAIWNFKRSKTLGDERLRFKVYFYLSKHINYIAKDASILHLNNNKPSYFLTSTLLKHSPIITTNLIEAIVCWDGEILISSLCQLDVLQILPLFFLFLDTFFKSVVCLKLKFCKVGCCFPLPQPGYLFWAKCSHLATKKNGNANPTKDFFIKTMHKVTIFWGKKKLNSPCLDNT